MPPTFGVEHCVTIHPCNKENDRELITSNRPLMRELAARESDGIHVVLLWHPGESALTISVEDARVGHRFRLAVAPERALDAFYHPFAYAA
jgi:hypothetical protein